jgi:Spy/CpxP family protein refolding chaperone
MNAKRTLARWAAAAGLCLLWAIPGVGNAQTQESAPTPRARANLIPDSKLKHPDPMEDFGGLTFTDAQKKRIEEIREKSRLRMHDVAVDTKIAPEARAAMLDGIQRMERGQVYQVLTTEQQNAVRKRIIARREAEQKERAAHQPQKAPPPPAQLPPH